MAIVTRPLIVALSLLAAAPLGAAEFTRAGWYRLEVLPSLSIDSERFASESACLASIAKGEDRVVRCVRLAKKGDEIDRAIDIFGAALKDNPGDASAMNYRGLLFEKKGDNASAIREFTAAIKAAPDDYWGFVFRADVRAKTGQKALAIADYREALARNPGDAGLVKILKEKVAALEAKP
jgi:tetratricopeptide (TPR) repeat protein